MGEPLPRLSLYVLLRSTTRMWLMATGATLAAWWITHQWLGARLRAVADPPPRFDAARWMSAAQIQEMTASYTPMMRAMQLPFGVADLLYAAMVAVLMAITMGWLMLKTPTRLSEALALGHVFWLPLASAVFEWGENAGFLYLLHAQPEQQRWVAEATSLFKTAHSITQLSCLALIAVLAVLAALYRLGSPPKS